MDVGAEQGATSKMLVLRGRVGQVIEVEGLLLTFCQTRRGQPAVGISKAEPDGRKLRVKYRTGQWSAGSGQGSGLTGAPKPA